jgi:hypothetical protein
MFSPLMVTGTGSTCLSGGKTAIIQFSRADTLSNYNSNRL